MTRPHHATWAARLGCSGFSLWLGLGGVAVAHAAPPDADASIDAPAEPPQPETTQPETTQPEPQTAAQWYARGIELGNAGDFVGAAAAFLNSYAQTPTSEALFNAGLAYQNAGDAIAAIEIYRRLLAEPERNPELARAAEEAIAKLTREVGTLKGLRFDAERPPAELYVAGQRRELDELPLLLAPGPVEIVVVDEQGQRGAETYELAAGEALVVDVRALLPARPEPPPPDLRIDTTQPSAEELAARERRSLRARQLRTTTWIGLGLTGAAAVSYATLTGLAARERRAYEADTCLDTGVCPDGFEPGDPEGHLLAYQRLRTGALISVGLAGGFAIGSLVVGLVSLRFERDPGRERARVRLAPSVGGLALQF